MAVGIIPRIPPASMLSDPTRMVPNLVDLWENLYHQGGRKLSFRTMIVDEIINLNRWVYDMSFCSRSRR
ncbi:hypothetical protein GOP47_0021549 [Adiantum capillus-veneris]|uniref:Uncharacterized protein n=1 Tax=Adiantum capillus-veneris TaxID=13818 RepID=A0A9D4U805_ADICA|nr:hypothetical protein GOP47_0021549 [Adiantum capillus-veneris]